MATISELSESTAGVVTGTSDGSQRLLALAGALGSMVLQFRTR